MSIADDMIDGMMCIECGGAFDPNYYETVGRLNALCDPGGDCLGIPTRCEACHTADDDHAYGGVCSENWLTSAKGGHDLLDRYDEAFEAYEARVLQVQNA